jgi:hypothetical protein
MILLNFAHPLTAEQIEQLQALSDERLEQIHDLPVQFDPDQPFRPQLAALLERTPLDAQSWQTEPILVNLPALNFISALLLAELHGRMGYFPPILRLRPVAGSLPPRYEVAEILNLQDVRAQARQKRY